MVADQTDLDLGILSLLSAPTVKHSQQFLRLYFSATSLDFSLSKSDPEEP